MQYTNFIGIDVGKITLVIAFDGEKKAHTVQNDPTALSEFITTHREKFTNAFVVLETTGGYETECLHTLLTHNIATHRASTLQAMHFRRSIHTRGKSDSIDAFALARYGAERWQRLALFLAPNITQSALQNMLARRDDLVQMRAAEKTRLQHPRYKQTMDSLVKHIAFLDEQITDLQQQIDNLLQREQEIQDKLQELQSIVGIGHHTAMVLIGYMPELGMLDRKQAASLAGLAPHPRESGTSVGYRSTCGGRFIVRKALFMAAMAAKRSSNSPMHAFFKRLVENGKKPIVAVVAVMRKLIVLANARLRDLRKPKPAPANSL